MGSLGLNIAAIATIGVFNMAFVTYIKDLLPATVSVWVIRLISAITGFGLVWLFWSLFEVPFDWRIFVGSGLGVMLMSNGYWDGTKQIGIVRQI